MEHSASVLSAQLEFIQERLSIVSIPIAAYSYYIQPIIKILDPVTDKNETNGANDNPWTRPRGFLSISITPLEITIIAPAVLIKRFIPSTIERLPAEHQCIVSEETYLAISVLGEGLDAGERVLGLSSPLAEIGIPIFFLSTYYSDFLVVPSRSRKKVIKTLQESGFTFLESSQKYVNLSSSHLRDLSLSSGPPTPPIAARTETLSQLNRVNPIVDNSLRLLQLGARDDKMSRDSLQLGLIKCLINQPRFFSVTLSEMELPSFLMSEDALHCFGDSQELLLGSRDAYLLSFLLDLRALSTEATGIVSRISSQLVVSTADQQASGIDIRYLSSFKSAAVIVAESDIEEAINLLSQGESGLAVQRI